MASWCACSGRQGAARRRPCAADRRVCRSRCEIDPARRAHDLGSRTEPAAGAAQQQWVALARALVVEPETLLLYEPLSNLDANLREEMRFESGQLEGGEERPNEAAGRVVRQAYLGAHRDYLVALGSGQQV